MLKSALGWSRTSCGSYALTSCRLTASIRPKSLGFPPSTAGQAERRWEDGCALVTCRAFPFPRLRHGPEVSDCKGVETRTTPTGLDAKSPPDRTHAPLPVAWVRLANQPSLEAPSPRAETAPTPWNAPLSPVSPGSPVSRGRRRDISDFTKQGLILLCS